MAFVAPLSVAATGRPTPALRASPLTALRPNVSAPAPTATAVPRMGYGDYSFTTDKTKGHVNQYYVDKLRVAADFVKGGPACDADAKLGRTMKGGVAVPKAGIPESRDAALAPIDTSVLLDPRVAEADGAVWAWDAGYADPALGADTFGDLDDADAADAAFQQFRASVSGARGAALSAQDFGAVARVQRIKAGVDVDYLCCLDGQLDAAYARLQKVDDPAVLSPTGVPQTEIPGTPFLRSVGALDLMPKPKDSVDFWSADSAPPAPYKKPSGADTPELPYNTAVSVDGLKVAQAARGLLPAEE